MEDMTVWEQVILQAPSVIGLTALAYVQWLENREKSRVIEKELDQCREVVKRALDLLERLTAVKSSFIDDGHHR